VPQLVCGHPQASTVRWWRRLCADGVDCALMALNLGKSCPRSTLEAITAQSIGRYLFAAYEFDGPS